MLKHYLLTVLRHLWKRRLYTSISLLSLIAGLTVFSLIVLHVRHELSYNTDWPDAGRIYRMTHKQGGTGANLPPSQGFTSQFVLNIRDYIGDYAESYAEISSLFTTIEDAATAQDSAPGAAGSTNRFQVTLADKAFLGIFALPEVAGNLDIVIDGSGFIALDTKSAELLFGSAADAMGKTVTVGGGLGFSSNPGFMPAQNVDFEVAAVYALPEPVSGSTEFQALVPANDYAKNLFPGFNGTRNFGLNVWYKLREGVDPETVNTALDHYLDEYLITTRGPVELRGGTYSELFDFRLQPLGDIYFNAEMNEVPNGDRTRLVTFGVVALLVLMAGSSNVISLGLAAAMERRREVGIRKAVGAVQQSIMLQYLGEAIMLSLLALIPTVILVQLLHPAFAGLLSITNMPDPGLWEVGIMTAICLCVGLINGLYPALVLARVRPVAVLKAQAGQSRLNRRLNLRGLLVTAQFCFSIALLVITSGLYMQLWITRNQPLGLDVNGLASASVNFAALQARNDVGQVFANELAAMPGITAVVPVLRTPMLNTPSVPTLQLVNTQQDVEGVPVRDMPFKPGVFSLLGIPQLAGRDLNAESDTMPTAVAAGAERPLIRVAINRSAARALGFDTLDSVVGQRYYLLSDTGATRSYDPIEVVGVVEDSLVYSLRERPGAEFYYLQPVPANVVLFRYDEAVASSILARVNDVALDVTGYAADTAFLEERMTQVFTEEQRESRLLLLCAALALFLSCIGLYGLVSVALKTQVKEIGVRKVLGASTIGVVKVFLSRFSVPVLVANVIAWPVAVYAVFEWIQRFPYQLEKIWLLPICLAVTAVVFLIAWVTVGALTLRAASTPPVRSLRYE